MRGDHNPFFSDRSKHLVRGGYCPGSKERTMSHTEETPLTRQQLIDLLNEDLSREYQAIIAYINYSQVLKGAQYMNIAKELEVHAREELAHALTIAGQIDYLANYRIRVRQCEAMGEYAIAENIRQILMQEQEHQIDLATALGVDVPDVTTAAQRA
jgi:bacterioferritin